MKIRMLQQKIISPNCVYVIACSIALDSARAIWVSFLFKKSYINKFGKKNSM